MQCASPSAARRRRRGAYEAVGVQSGRRCQVLLRLLRWYRIPGGGAARRVRWGLWGRRGVRPLAGRGALCRAGPLVVGGRWPGPLGSRRHRRGSRVPRCHRAWRGAGWLAGRPGWQRLGRPRLYLGCRWRHVARNRLGCRRLRHGWLVKLARSIREPLVPGAGINGPRRLRCVWWPGFRNRPRFGHVVGGRRYPATRCRGRWGERANAETGTGVEVGRGFGRPGSCIVRSGRFVDLRLGRLVVRLGT